ncbi:MAG: hypothetical protein IK013_05935 [Bacteroidales bacterium]|nr:hypothetical protein [Bacteroidales bacterium]
MIHYIIKALQQAESIYVNDLGTFSLHYESARIEGEKLLPPRNVVTLDTKTGDDNLGFTNFICREKQCLLTEANREITQWVEELKNALAHNKSVSFEDFGTFSLDSKGRLTFEALDIPDLNIEFEGMPALSLNVTDIPTEEPEDNEPQTEEIKTEEPVAIEEPIAAEEPAVTEQQTEDIKTEEPVAIEEPIAAEEPEVTEQQTEDIKTEEPVAIEEPIAAEEPEVTEQQTEDIKTEEPVAIEEPIAAEEPEVTEQQTEDIKTEEPVAIEEPIAAEEPEEAKPQEEEAENEDSEVEETDNPEETETPKKRRSLWWLYTLLVLLLLAALGYIFRDKIQEIIRPVFDRLFHKEVEMTEPDEIDTTSTAAYPEDTTAVVESDTLPEETPYEPEVVKTSSAGYPYIRFEQGHYYAIAGSFLSEKEVLAHIRAKHLDEYSPKLVLQEGAPNIRICIGIYDTEEEAEAFAKSINPKYWVLK